MPTEQPKLHEVIEAVLMTAGRPLPLAEIHQLLRSQDESITLSEVKQSLADLALIYEPRAVNLCLLAKGYRFTARRCFSPWLVHLWQEKPAKYSKALLETLAIIAYRQPVTRAEIEDIRGVAVSSAMIKTLLEREWVAVVGQREVPGRPAIYATTAMFLDYFNLARLDDLPSLSDLQSIESLLSKAENASLTAECINNATPTAAIEPVEKDASSCIAHDEPHAEGNGAFSEPLIETVE